MIEIASQLSLNEEEEDTTSHLSIDEIKETARQLGIPENKIDQAYSILEKQKEEMFRDNPRGRSEMHHKVSLHQGRAVVRKPDYGDKLVSYDEI